MATQSKLRREEVRRQKSERDEPLLRRLRERLGLATPSICAGFLVAGLLVMFYGAEPLPYYIGQEVRGPILARVAYDVVDEEKTEESKDLARQQVPNYYELNEPLIARITGALRTLYNAAQIESYEAYRQQLSQEPLGPAAAETSSWELDEPAYAALHELTGEDGKARF